MAASKKIIPGYGFTMGVTMFYLSIMFIIPMLAFIIYSSSMGWEKFISVVTDYRIIHGYYVSFICAFVAAAINGIFGLLLAWVLVRYDFFGKRILDGLIDLPFALPTAVAGIALTTLYAENGWLGSIFHQFGIETSFSTIGITIALIFVGIPFVARSVQPVLNDLSSEQEEAARIFGASEFKIFHTIIFPELINPLLTGFALAFARGIGEYGSVVFIAGNMPFKTEIAPLLIMSKLEQFDYEAAAAIAIVMMMMSFAILLSINGFQRWRLKKEGITA